MLKQGIRFEVRLKKYWTEKTEDSEFGGAE